MSGSLEEAYVAVERAYGQGDFAGALQLAEALQPQVPPGRPDLLDQRLLLLLGHIHLYGLNQPVQAAAAYTAVIEGCSEPSYRELASQGLEISRQQMPIATEPETPAAPEVPADSEASVSEASVSATSVPAPMGTAALPTMGDATGDQPLPATPWLNQLQDPQQALQQIQQARATASPAQPARAVAAPTPGGAAAAPWQPGGTATVEVSQPAVTESADAMPDATAARQEASSPEPQEAMAASASAVEQPGMGETTAAPETASPETSGLAIQPAEASAAEPEDAQAIIPVVVTVEEDESAAEAESPTEATNAEEPEPDVPAAPTFSEEEWADFKRGLLLVELTTSNEGPTR